MISYECHLAWYKFILCCIVLISSIWHGKKRPRDRYYFLAIKKRFTWSWHEGRMTTDMMTTYMKQAPTDSDKNRQARDLFLQLWNLKRKIKITVVSSCLPMFLCFLGLSSNHSNHVLQLYQFWLGSSYPAAAGICHRPCPQMWNAFCSTSLCCNQQMSCGQKAVGRRNASLWCIRYVSKCQVAQQFIHKVHHKGQHWWWLIIENTCISHIHIYCLHMIYHHVQPVCIFGSYHWEWWLLFLP